MLQFGGILIWLVALAFRPAFADLKVGATLKIGRYLQFGKV
jgi:hypothetical protein